MRGKGALLNRRYTLMDADGGKADRTFEPQIHADGRGWARANALFDVRAIALLNRRYTRMDADGGKGDRSFLHYLLGAHPRYLGIPSQY